MPNKSRLPKIVLTGASCGKTATIRTYINEEFTESNNNFIDRYVIEIEANGDYLQAEVHDMPSNSAFNLLRRHSYKNTDVFVIFFSVHSRRSFNDIKHTWLPEIDECPNVPYILVGTTTFLGRTFIDGKRVTLEEGVALAEEVGAVCYLECCPDRKYNVERVFVEAVTATLRNKENKNIKITSS